MISELFGSKVLQPRDLMVQGRDASDVTIVTTWVRIYWRASEMLVICTPAYSGERTKVNSLAAYQPVIGAGFGDLGHSCAEGEFLSFRARVRHPLHDDEHHSTPMAV